MGLVGRTQGHFANKVFIFKLFIFSLVNYIDIKSKSYDIVIILTVNVVT